jgi:hypothetical protein
MKPKTKLTSFSSVSFTQGIFNCSKRLNFEQLKYLIESGFVMTKSISPLVSEFESEDQATSYTAWLQDKIKRSVEDTRPLVVHDQLMAELESIISQAELKRKMA